jgi:hypothetical protein
MKTQKQAIPKTLLLSTTKLTDDHLQAVLKENEIERSWYADVPGYDSIEAIKADVEVGNLVQVKGDANMRPIMRLRNPELAETYPPYLKTTAAALLAEIGDDWRREMEAEKLDQTITIAITSLVRTLEYQATLVEAGKLADPQSPHTRGVAFDLDASGYYLGDVPINPRSGMQADFDEAFGELGIDDRAVRFGDQRLYDPHVHRLLKQVLELSQADGKLHFVHEFPGTGNDVFHVCVNPGYQP